YFSSLGLAFLVVEVLALQRTILFLGHPTLNLAVVLAAFLIGAGAGSLASERGSSRRDLGLVLVAAAFGSVARLGVLGALHSPLDPLPLAARCAAVALCVLPVAFVMGMPFAWGVRLLPSAARDLLPWYWGLNGAASVTGSALAVAVVLESG